MLESTSKFKVHDVVYKKNGFAIARGQWDGQTEYSLACRWYEDDSKLGYPQTFGKPQWMLLPGDVIVEIIASTDPNVPKVVVTFN